MSIETIQNQNNEYVCLSNYGRELSKRKLVDWFSEVQQLGVGEIILTSISSEGMGNGFDFEMLELINNKINVPLIIHGGAGNQNHIYEVLKLEKISGVAISSLLHYSFIKGKNLRLMILMRVILNF